MQPVPRDKAAPRGEASHSRSSTKLSNLGARVRDQPRMEGETGDKGEADHNPPRDSQCLIDLKINSATPAYSMDTSPNTAGLPMPGGSKKLEAP